MFKLNYPMKLRVALGEIVELVELLRRDILTYKGHCDLEVLSTGFKNMSSST